jgi:hypothetical protein
MTASDWIVFGALVVSAIVFIAGEVRARRAKLVRNERSDVRWEFSWPEATTIRVTNRGLDTAQDVDVEFTNDFIVSSGKSVSVVRDGSERESAPTRRYQTRATPASRKIRDKDAVEGTGIMPSDFIFSWTLIGPWSRPDCSSAALTPIA